MKQAILLVLGWLISPALLAQSSPEISVRLSFNAAANRYEVIARAGFSARNFAWGPSQVSVVLPASLADQPLSIRSLLAGSWADNSAVFAPAAAPTADFHGITSQGDKLDLVAGQDYVLFDFGLQPGYVDKVRLYDESKDPNSAQAGMQGGDFRNYMSDIQGNDYLKIDSRVASLLILAIEGNQPVSEADSLKVVAYPNPSVGGKFRLYMKGFAPGETVTVKLTNANGVVLRSFSERVATLAGREIDGSELGGYSVLTVERKDKPERISQKIWFQ
ncbi:hypothetical protein [Fibrella arboris]|uniref:hypothetical protein n=1 Tax=Fibrella arboris TaxID=3242486 RepID=UPI003521B641